jgi:predicted Zn-dependent protease
LSGESSEQDEARVRRGTRAAGGDGPRFDLRFEAGRGFLRLSRPLDAGTGRAVALDLGLGHVRFPVDVTGGATVFRHRRTRVRSATFHVDVADLRRAADARGIGLTVGDASDGIAIGLRDDFGVLGLDVVPLVDGRDLCFFVRSHRAVNDGPANPFRRIVEATSALGLAFDGGTGVFRLERPARTLLAQALVTRGFRLPDDRGVDLVAPRRENGTFAIELGNVDAAAAERTLAAAEEARVAAPVLRCLADDDVEGAADEALRLVRRLEERRAVEPWLIARALTLALTVDAERPGVEEEVLRGIRERDDALAAATAVRLCLRVDDREGAAEAVKKMIRLEPISELAAEGLTFVSSELSKTDPKAALLLVSRAAARRPSDPRLALERVELARRSGDLEEIERAAKKALGAPLSSRDRARVASAAAQALERLDHRGDAERLYREALFASPDDPSALEGLAGLFAARGDRAAAVLRLDRAARSHLAVGDGKAAASALRRAAELLVRSSRSSAAEERLVRAIRHRDDDPALFCALARVRADVGDVGGAGAAYDRLLDLEGRAGAGLIHALVEAACFYFDDAEDPEGARAFVEMVARRAPGDSRLGPLQHRLERGDRTVPGAIPAVARRRPDDDQTEVTESNVDELANTELIDIDRVEATLAGDPTDPDALSTLEARTEEPGQRAELARALANALRQRGEDVEAARALARAGVLDRDLSTIRAALDLAERVKAHAAVRDIVDRALSIVGEGPAKEMLLRRRRRASTREKEDQD